MTRRLLASYLTVTLVVLAVLVVPLGLIFADHESDALYAALERDATSSAAVVEDDLEAGVPPRIDTLLTQYAGGGGRIVVVDRRGISQADSEDVGGAGEDFRNRPEIAAALAGERATGTRRSETLGGDLVYVAVPVTSGGQIHGAVRVTYPIAELDHRIQENWIRLGLLSAAVLLGVALVGAVLARQVTRPVRLLEDAARDLADGRLDTRVPTTGGPPELRSLAGTFNRTADQLERLLTSQRQFVADASHQLRTPLTALRLRLENLARHLPPEQQPRLQAAVDETDRLARLVESLSSWRVPTPSGQPRPSSTSPRSSPGGWTRGHRWPRRAASGWTSRPARWLRCSPSPGHSSRSWTTSSPTPSPPRRRAGGCNSRWACGHPARWRSRSPTRAQG